MWNTIPSGGDSVAGNTIPSLEVQSMANDSTPSNDIPLDSDAAVSEKVLLDTVAEKEVMDRLQVSYARPIVCGLYGCHKGNEERNVQYYHGAMSIE